MLNLFVTETDSGLHVPVKIQEASEADLKNTSTWQTNWTSAYVSSLPNKVSLHRSDDGELLGLMSYDVNMGSLAVEIIYLESALHSNGNLLHQTNESKKYTGIARALFAYAAYVSKECGCEGVLVFKAKTSELVEYYIREFGARHVGSYDPFRLVIWNDAAEELMKPYGEE